MVATVLGKHMYKLSHPYVGFVSCTDVVTLLQVSWLGWVYTVTINKNGVEKMATLSDTINSPIKYARP